MHADGDGDGDRDTDRQTCLHTYQHEGIVSSAHWSRLTVQALGLALEMDFAVFGRLPYFLKMPWLKALDPQACRFRV